MKKLDKDSVFIGVGLGSVVTLIITLAVITISQNRHLFSLKDISNLNEFTDTIESLYYKDIDKDEVRSGAYNGLFTSLDKYSSYISPKDYEDEKKHISEEYSGIGITSALDVYTKCYRVVKVTDGSPASKAGIRVNDVIKEVNGESVTDIKLDDITKRIRGRKGTFVKLKILRGEDIFVFNIERKDIKISYSTSYQLNKETGYISLSSFSGNAFNDFKKSLEKVKDSKNIILDLRNNLGGDVDILMKILTQISPNGLVTTLHYKDGGIDSYKINDGKGLRYKFVILVNDNSASCSEIMASYMQENNYATVIGKKTYGKGVVQGRYELSNGGAIKLTIAYYLTPKGKNLSKKGVVPDIETNNEYNELSCLKDVLNDKDVKIALSTFK